MQKHGQICKHAHSRTNVLHPETEIDKLLATVDPPMAAHPHTQQTHKSTSQHTKVPGELPAHLTPLLQIIITAMTLYLTDNK